MGYLASVGEITEAVVAQAVIAGSALASFAVADFGLDELLRLTPDALKARLAEFKRLTYFEDL